MFQDLQMCPIQTFIVILIIDNIDMQLLALNFDWHDNSLGRVNTKMHFGPEVDAISNFLFIILIYRPAHKIIAVQQKDYFI